MDCHGYRLACTVANTAILQTNAASAVNKVTHVFTVRILYGNS